MATEKNKPKQVGRKPKADPCRHRLAINLNDADFARFLTLFEQSGLQDRAHFITACIFERQLKVVKIDKAAMDYYMRLTTFHAQFRAIGMNYNQVVKAIKSTFTEKKALAFLYKLEQATKELVAFQQKIEDLTAEFERNYLNRNL
ncbi:conjugal transfer protein MobA [Viscerimonas tarda]